MVALRSRRLESLFGVGLGALRAEHVRGLVSSSVQEAFDLDFEAALYGRGDSDRRVLAGDVAALANTAGSVILLGVQEDDQARATAAPSVEITDAEVARIRQVIASLVAPIPMFDVLTMPDTAAGDDDAAGEDTARRTGPCPADGTVEEVARGSLSSRSPEALARRMLSWLTRACGTHAQWRHDPLPI